MKDAVLQTKAKAALAAEPFVSVFRIETEVDEGVITVRGSVDNYAQKDRVEELLTSLKGVNAVANQLTVGDAESTDILDDGDYVTSLSDEEVQDLQERIPHLGSAQLAVDPNKIKVDVTNQGLVHLGGELPSNRHRQQMETILWRIPEVSYVINRVEAPDDEIEGTVVEQPGLLSRAAATIKFKAGLISESTVRRPLNVGSEVHGDVVVLSGDVDSYLAKEWVIEYAKQVYPGLEIADDMTVGQELDPDQIIGDTRVDARAVPNEPTKDDNDDPTPQMRAFPGMPYAGSFAQGGMVSGGAGAVIPMKKLTNAGRTDAKTEVLGAIEAEASLEPSDFSVHVTTEGTCLLMGRVKSEQEARRIEELALEVRGVDHVMDFLEISS